MFHLYIMPLIGDGTTKETSRRAKYRDDIRAEGGSWVIMDYGYEPVCLLRADVSDKLHATMQADPEVISIPDDLDTLVDPVGVQTALDDFNIPTKFLSGLSWREFVRILSRLFQLFQRLHYIHGSRRVFSAKKAEKGAAFSSLPAQVRANLRRAIQSFNKDDSKLIGGNDDIDDVVLKFAEQFTEKVYLGGFEI